MIYMHHQTSQSPTGFQIGACITSLKIYVVEYDLHFTKNETCILCRGKYIECKIVSPMGQDKCKNAYDLPMYV